MQSTLENSKVINEHYVPKVSIGLPVYNGEKYLAQSIKSVLAQDFEDFDFLISDNCSTDSTWEICNHYADKDKRIRLNRNSKNLGAIANFQLVLDQTKSKYFMWQAHDDIMMPSCVSKCFRFLEDNIEHVLCFSRSTFVDEEGNSLYSDIAQERSEGNDVARFRNQWLDISSIQFYGLIRRNTLNKIGRLPVTVWWFDWILICELALAGKSHVINEVLRYIRYPTGLKGNLKILRRHGPHALLGSRSTIAFLPFTRSYLTLLSRIKHSSFLSEDIKPELLEITRHQMPPVSLVSNEIGYYRNALKAYALAILSGSNNLQKIAKTVFRYLR